MNPTRNTRWPQVIASGALWAAVYNFVWGLSWLAFMRHEWLGATAAINMELPWTASDRPHRPSGGRVGRDRAQG